MFSRRLPRLCLAFVFLSVTPYSPGQYLILAKEQRALDDKIFLLRQCIKTYPQDSAAARAREQLVTLLAGSNRYEEALAVYRENRTQEPAKPETDFTLLEYLLKTGRYNDLLRETSIAPGPQHDFVRDQKLMEFRVQALLAQGHYGLAEGSIDHWLERYAADGIEGGRFEGDVRSVQFLQKHLRALVRMQGAEGKPIFTASVPDSLQHWSHRQDVPIVFFKLVPAHPGGQLYEPLMPGRHEGEDFFQDVTDEMNRGLHYLSQGQFSLKFGGLHTLYVTEGDLDPSGPKAGLLTSRVYVHTIPELYRLDGQAFVVLIDYRYQSEDEAAYMGDGLIHLAANKLQTMVLMHEVLHGLGATHQEWGALIGQGYRFDPEDRGLMTFENGELKDLGLEEKNRALLGWPHVAVLRMQSDTAAVPTFNNKS